MENLLWFFAVAIGPFLLGAVMVFVLMRQRPLSRREKMAQNNKIDELYDENGRSN